MHAASKSAPELPLDSPGAWKRGLLWAGVALAVIGGAVWGFTPLPDARPRLAAVPLQAAGLAGAEVRLTPSEQAAFSRVTVLHRRYQYGGREFFVTAVDGTRDRHLVHDPRYCFQGAGWRIVGERPIALPGGDGTWLRAEFGERQAQALFWYSEGTRRYSSPLRFWWQTTLRRLTLGRSGPEPVMVMMQSVSVPEPEWPELARATCTGLGL